MLGDASIDILMGTYNGAEFLEQQIESLLAQTCSDWRLLVRDDGSTDETVTILDTMSQAQPRIQIVKDDLGRLGAGQNFHHLLGLSTAPYVMFCDQDDVWLPRKIELTFERMRAAEKGAAGLPTLVHCDAAVTDRDLEITWERFIGAKARRNGLSAQLFTQCVQGAALMINSPLRERALRMRPVLSHDYHVALIAAAVGQRCFVDEALLLYRQHARNAVGIKEVKSANPSKVSPTLQLAIDAHPYIQQTVGFFRDELSRDVAKELEDFSEVINGKSTLRRLSIALRRRYAFYRRRDRLNLLLYILGIRNV